MSETRLTRSLVCPDCRGPLELADTEVGCEACAWRRARSDGYLPLSSRESVDPQGLGPRAMRWRPLARIYEKVWRPAFVSVASRRVADRYDEEAWVEARLLEGAGGEFADLSCGPGWMARRLSTRAAFTRVYGVDLSPAMLSVCIDAARREAAPVIAVQGDVGRLPFVDNCLGAAHAGAALHLWPEPGRALREVGRVLRSQGAFVASTFVHPARWGAQKLIEESFERLTKVRFFEVDELEGLCAAAGLVNFEARIQGAWIVFSARAI